MKLLISPPIRFGNQFNGAMRRTLEVYSRINEEVYLCIDDGTFHLIDEDIKPLLYSFQTVKSNSTDRLKYLIGFARCLNAAKKVDFILSYSEYSFSVIYSYLLSLFSRKPLIIFVQHVTEELKGDSIYYNLLKSAFNRSLGIISLDSEEVVNELKSLFPYKKIVTSTNGINAKDYYTLDEKICDCLFIGNYSERKGVKYLKEICERLDYKLCIIGNGWNEKNLPKNSVYYGFVSEKVKRDILAKSKIFVFPSLYEGFGLVVIEALASYLPVVTWDLPWSKRFNEGVVKVKFGDVKEFAKTVKELLSNEEKRKMLGIKGRMFAEKMSWENAANMEKKAIRDIFNSRNF